VPDNRDQNRERTVILGDKALRELRGFTQVPNFILKHPKLSFGAKVAFGVLLSYAWQDNFCYPPQEHVANDMACSVRQVQRLLTELKVYGLVSWKQQGLNRPNIYTVLPKGILNTSASPDTTNMSSPDTTLSSRPVATNPSHQNTTNMAYKEYSLKKTQHVDVEHIEGERGLRPILKTIRLADTMPSRPTTDVAKVSYLAEEMARVSGDRKRVSMATFRRIASALGEQGSFELIAVTNEAVRDGIIRDAKRGAYLVGVAKKMAEARGIDLGLRSGPRNHKGEDHRLA